MQALTLGRAPGTIEVRTDVPIPRPGDNEVFVEIHYAGQNPPDTYVLDPVRSAAYQHPDNVMGSDFAGIVRESNASHIAVGEKVCGWLPGNATTRGAFAQYAVCDADLVIRCPDDIPMEQLAALPFSFFTALHGLVCELNVDLESGKGPAVLVWGAGTACGQYAVQLLVQARVPVVAVSSRSSLESLQRMGVSAAYPREDIPQTCAAIRKAWPGLELALDCFGSTETVDACASVLRSGHVHVLVPSQPSVSRPDVRVTFALVHSMLGRRTDVLGMLPVPPTPEELAADYKVAVSYASFDKGHLYRLLRQGAVQPLPVQIWPLDSSAEAEDSLSRLDGIKSAIEQAAAGQTPSGKIVHRVGAAS